MRATLFVLAIVSAPLTLNAVESHANPIRKVVVMLEAMQKKVNSEGEKETELYEKFQCYCKNAGGDLSGGIADAEAKVPQLTADIEKAESRLALLKEEVKQHQDDRAAAKDAMAQATALREEAASAFGTEDAEYVANVGAVKKATSAIAAGMKGGFLQTAAAQALRQLASKRDMLNADRQDLQAFLSEHASYAPSGGQITGILKTMQDEMDADGKAAREAEAAAIKTHAELMAAKKKEVAALTQMIEEKLTRIGDLGVEIATMKNDLGDTAQGLLEDKKFLADLDKNCKTKAAEHAENVKMRGLEIEALADTIRVLNDDDTLELFKKTLPSASASLLQVQVSAASTRSRALAFVLDANSRRGLQVGRPRGFQLDFIALALHNKKIGFEKVIKMIDDMTATLKQEQVDDDSKKEYCAAQFDLSDDSKKTLERSISDLEAGIAAAEEGISSLKEEIKALVAGIKKLDETVAEATEQRKSENSEFKDLMASDSAAKEVLEFAKNRLNKFYNPKLYKAPAKRELTEEERLTVNNGGTLAPTAAPGGIAGTGIAVLSQVAPPPPPATAAAYSKSSEESGGVIGMIDLLIKDLEKEMTVAKAAEKDAQGDYEGLMSDSAEKRAEDSKALGDKEAALAEMEADLQAKTGDKASAGKELMATLQYIQSLHNECDWLIQYFDVRREARAGEIDAMAKAKAVLSGADYSLMQTTSRRSLRRRT